MASIEMASHPEPCDGISMTDQEPCDGDGDVDEILMRDDNPDEKTKPVCNIGQETFSRRQKKKRVKWGPLPPELENWPMELAPVGKRHTVGRGNVR